MKRKLSNVLSLSIGLIILGGANRAAAQLEGEYQVQPIFSRYAETQKKWVTFNTTARVFNGVDLQEANSFDGWGIDADVTLRVPFTKYLQARVFWPFYTEGKGAISDPARTDYGQHIRIDGHGGVFDFPNVELEYQFLTESNSGFNASFHGGIGEAQRVLDTTAAFADVFNHAGQYALFGLRGDWHYGEDWRFVANLGGRYYWKSDDINPGGNFDEFGWADISGAAIWHPWKAPIFPVAELVYQGDFSSYNSLLFVPEIIWASCKNFEWKVGGTFGLTGDGESVGGRLQGTLRF